MSQHPKHWAANSQPVASDSATGAQYALQLDAFMGFTPAIAALLAGLTDSKETAAQALTRLAATEESRAELGQPSQ